MARTTKHPDRDAIMTTTIEIRPSGAALGADVLGADLSDPSGDALDRVRAALCDHLVLRVRGTALDDAGYVAFGRTFGEIEPPEAHTRTASMAAPEFPEMSVISNVVEDGMARGEAGDGELKWHTDHGFMERPAGFTMLLAREVPAKGGDTSFLNMYRAYEALPDDLRARIEGRSSKHQASHSSTGQRRPGWMDLASDDPRDLPGAIHPIVRTHPETGRKALFLGRRFGSYVPPLPLDESEALLDELWAHATRPEFAWTQRWQVGDLIIWDNRCTMHRRDGFAGHGRRRMHRLMTKGERPV
jgi:taurine dioxygenase